VCPKNFRESLITPTATFPEIFNELLFQSILLICIQNLKFIALHIPAITGGTQKIWVVPRSLYSTILTGFCWDGPLTGQICLKSVALPVPEITAIDVFG